MENQQPPKPKLPRGSPPLLTPEVSANICALISGTKAPIVAAAAAVGIGRTTVFSWLARGRAEGVGPYADFLNDVELARARGTTLMLGHIAKAAQNPRNWQAAVKLLEMTERREFGPQVRIIQEELDATLDRLEHALPPDVFELVLAAIASDSGREAAGGAEGSEAGGASEGGAGEEAGATELRPVGTEGVPEI